MPVTKEISEFDQRKILFLGDILSPTPKKSIDLDEQTVYFPIGHGLAANIRAKIQPAESSKAAPPYAKPIRIHIERNASERHNGSTFRVVQMGFGAFLLELRLISTGCEEQCWIVQHRILPVNISGKRG